MSSSANHRGDHGDEALDAGIIAIAGLDGEGARPGGVAIEQPRFRRQPCIVDALDIAGHGFGARGHGGVDPGGNRHRVAAQEITTKPAESRSPD